MSKYKVGDKVLLEGEVFKIEKDNIPYPYGIRIAKNVEFMFGETEIISKVYEDGLANAWELARKIENELDMPTTRSIFGSYRIADILDNFTYQEALKILEAYEKSQQIQVGDVVYETGYENEEHGVVTRYYDDKDIQVLWDSGYSAKCEKEDLVKTGRHIDIEHLLEQIRGNE